MFKEKFCIIIIYEFMTYQKSIIIIVIRLSLSFPLNLGGGGLVPQHLGLSVGP